MSRVNRLSGSTSPYLLQHADNPVDWWEWGDAAFAEARRRDVPILLSVGYAACHWCHVMADESFEDEATAALVNDSFVAIKVDREERPDVDAVYMDATTALTGHGGWPMTCLLTHDGSPFYAGTYFPRERFQQLLRAASSAWRERRSEVDEAGGRIVAALANAGLPESAAGALGTVELDAAAAALAPVFDRTHGGFGGAPKFPPSMVLEFLLRHHERTGDPVSLAMAEQTMDAMARGGMYDQLGGGFARYSVDAAWVVPHFEKMLYDNALLLRAYLHLWRLTGSNLAWRVARETADFLLRDLRTAEGGFASALDADTDGVEGATYVWTPAQLADVLGADAPAAADLLAVSAQGSFEHGTSTLQLRADPSDPSVWDGWRRRLFEARGRRPQPGRDDKVVTAWNGLAIAALAEAGVLLGEPSYLRAAEACARLLVETHLVDGRLRRTSRDGVAGAAKGVAEDYGDLADGLSVLYQATGDAHWLDRATQLLDIALKHFRADDGSFFDTADDAETLVRRPRDPTDNATPSGASALIAALVAVSALTGSIGYREAAEQAIASVGEFTASQPRFFGATLAAAEALADGPRQVAIVGDDDGLLSGFAWRRRPPGAVVVSGAPGADGQPLLAERPLIDGRAAAYVCRGMVCDLPVTDTASLGARLSGRAPG